MTAVIHIDAVVQFIAFVLGVLSPFLIGLFSLVILVVVPELVNTFTLMVENINEFIPTMKEWILVIFKDNTDVQKWLNAHPLDVNTLLQKLVEFLQNGAGDFLSGTISQVAGVITGVVDFAMGFVFACYILAQKERLADQVRRLGQAVFSEHQYIRAEEICALFYKNFSSFIAGQCMDAAILGVMFVVGMTIFRLPYALLIGVVIGFTALIPVLGAFIGCVVGIVLILTVNPIQAVVFVILPAIWVMAAVIVGGGLMGIIGMLIFIPLVSVLYNLLRSWTYRRLEEKNAVNGGESAGENGDAASRQKAENEKQGRKRWMIKRQ